MQRINISVIESKLYNYTNSINAYIFWKSLYPAPSPTALMMAGLTMIVSVKPKRFCQN